MTPARHGRTGKAGLACRPVPPFAGAGVPSLSFAAAGFFQFFGLFSLGVRFQASTSHKHHSTALPRIGRKQRKRKRKRRKVKKRRLKDGEEKKNVSEQWARVLLVPEPVLGQRKEPREDAVQTVRTEMWA
jgi:hypothetical protein